MIFDAICGFLARLIFRYKSLDRMRDEDLLEAQLALHEAQKSVEYWSAKARMLRGRVARLGAAS